MTSINEMKLQDDVNQPYYTMADGPTIVELNMDIHYTDTRYLTIVTMILAVKIMCV